MAAIGGGVSDKEQPCSISSDISHPLEVALTRFQHMPDKQAVSLLLPEARSQTRVRLVNMSPQTALNLLAWLEDAKETLERLVSA